jgi:hypothetical protein
MIIPTSERREAGVPRQEGRHPWNASNVMLPSAESYVGKANRVAHKVTNRQQTRICKKCGGHHRFKTGRSKAMAKKESKRRPRPALYRAPRRKGKYEMK